MSDPRIAACLSQCPFAGRKRRIVADVLVMSTFELCAPMVFGIAIEADDLPVHLRRARSRYRDFSPAGFHHKKIVNAMNQQTPDAMTSGIS